MPRPTPRPLDREETIQLLAAKNLFSAALQARWPTFTWDVRRCATQPEGQVRISVIWMAGPSVEEVSTVLARLPLPPGPACSALLRRRPEPDHRKPPIITLQSSAAAS